MYSSCEEHSAHELYPHTPRTSHNDRETNRHWQQVQLLQYSGFFLAQYVNICAYAVYSFRLSVTHAHYADYDIISCRNYLVQAIHIALA